jgi:antitoxin component YwqK of YwqJK toxin-antitoxin module
MIKSLIFTGLIFSVFVGYGQQINAQDGKYYGSNGAVFSGTLEQKNTLGQKEATLTIENGHANGVCTFYYTSGKVQEMGAYTAGLKDGMWEQFAENGIKTGEAFYKLGKKDGVWTMWDEQGNKRYHMVYSMGQKIDVWKIWDENQNLVSERVYNEK